MGAKQSKRSVDISGKETEGAEGAGEVAAAGAGGEGRVEPLADADALKPQLNGDAHIHETTDKEKQLDSGTPENEKDVTTEKEGKEQEDNEKEKEEAPVTNGESEQKGEDGDGTPAAEDSKKPKKEKVKKKWSIRSISFSRKDKPKQEKKQKDDEPKTNGEPEKVPEEVPETTPETEVNEVAEEAKPCVEVKEEKTPETPVTEPITNGSSTPETPKVETPAAEEPSKESPENDRPEVKIEPEPEKLPLNGLSLEESKTETPDVDQIESDPSKPEETTVESSETVPATEIPVTKEVCVDQMPLIEPTPPPLPANPPPSSVASFAATTMAPELTDASLANAADITTNTAPTTTTTTDTITKADDTIDIPIEVQNIPSDAVIAPSKTSQSEESTGQDETNNTIKLEKNIRLDQCSVIQNVDISEVNEENDAAKANTNGNLNNIVKENSVPSFEAESVKISTEISIQTASEKTTNEISNVTTTNNSNEIPVDVPNESPADICNETSVDICNEAVVEISNEVPVDVPNESPADICNETSVDICNEAVVEISHEVPVGNSNDVPVDISNDVPVDISNDVPVDISNETPVDISNQKSVDIPHETLHDIPTEKPDNILGGGQVEISEVQTAEELKIVREVLETKTFVDVSNNSFVDSVGDALEPERENTPSPQQSAVDEDVTTQNDAEDIVTEVYDGSDLILESPTIVVNSDHIDTNSIKSNQDTEMENIKNKSKDTVENIMDNTECNGMEEHKVITNGEATQPAECPTDEGIGEVGKGASTPEDSMPPSLSEVTEALPQGEGSESFPLPPSELCRSESEASPPATPEPLADVPADIPQEMLKTDIIAELIPEMPAVAELKTEMETTSDVAVAN